MVRSKKICTYLNKFDKSQKIRKFLIQKSSKIHSQKYLGKKEIIKISSSFYFRSCSIFSSNFFINYDG